MMDVLSMFQQSIEKFRVEQDALDGCMNVRIRVDGQALRVCYYYICEIDTKTK